MQIIKCNLLQSIFAARTWIYKAQGSAHLDAQIAETPHH
jgi:hypothetical protein